MNGSDSRLKKGANVNDNFRRKKHFLIILYTRRKMKILFGNIKVILMSKFLGMARK